MICFLRPSIVPHTQFTESHLRTRTVESSLEGEELSVWLNLKWILSRRYSNSALVTGMIKSVCSNLLKGCKDDCRWGSNWGLFSLSNQRELPVIIFFLLLSAASPERSSAERAKRAEVSRRSAVKFLRARLRSGRLTSPRQPIAFPPDAAFQRETSWVVRVVKWIRGRGSRLKILENLNYYSEHGVFNPPRLEDIFKLLLLSDEQPKTWKCSKHYYHS